MPNAHIRFATLLPDMLTYDTYMSDTLSPMPGRSHLTADDWAATGLKVLVDSGVGAVKILPLAQGMGVTRGSFYWHFKNRAALLERLLDAWEATNTRAILEAAAGPGTLVDRYIALSRLWLGWSDFDPRLDAAVRNWGRCDAAVLKRLKAADERRVAAFAEMIEPEGHGLIMTQHRAHALYHVQMGWCDDVETPTDGRGESSASYFEIFLGRAPSPSERKAIMGGHRSR